MNGKNDHGRNAAPLLSGLAAFVTWGIVPVYWKLLKDISAPQILAHRFVWTIVFLAAILTWQRRWREVIATATNPRPALFCLSSGVAVSLNWLIFIWAVNIGRVLETSLGYFMTPIVNVLLGALILRERLSLAQLGSILIASAGVVFMTIGYGQFPWIAICLCITFGFYGLLRKQSGTAAITGFFLETTFLSPIAIVYLAILAAHRELIFGQSHFALSALLISTGIVTALPLVWFGYAARHLRLVTIGFLQYLSPSISFFLGVFLYRETFTAVHLITFSLIWIALALVSTEAVMRWRSRRQLPAEELIEPSI